MNAYETLLMTAGAVVFPCYLAYSWHRQAFTLRDATGGRTTYTREEEPRSFFLGLGMMATGTVLTWSLLLT